MPGHRRASPREVTVHAEQLTMTFAGGHICACVCGKSSGVRVRELDARNWLTKHLEGKTVLAIEQE